MDKAELAARGILLDLTGRGGLGNVWDEIAEDIQDDILDTWTNIIQRVMSQDTSSGSEG